MKLSEQILSKRKELNLTQKDLAIKLGVTDKTVSRWETGVSIPDIEMLKKMSLVIGLHLTDIFNEVEIKRNNLEEIDSKVINQFRNAFITSTLLLIFAAMLFFMIKTLPSSNDSTSNIVFTIFFVLAVLFIMASLIIYIISICIFKSKVTKDLSRKRYMNEIKVSTLFILISVVLVIISLIIQ